MPTKIPTFGTGGDVSNPIRGNTLLISDYVDFLPGVNYETFYWGYAYDSTGAKASLLWPETFNSVDDDTIASEDGVAFSKEIDLDFDYTINGERLIGGDFMANIRMEGGENSGAVEYYTQIRIKKNDVEIGTAKTFTGTITQNYTVLVFGNIANTHFNIGDNLRITIEGWIKSSLTDANNDIKIYHDGSAASSSIKIPFLRLDEY